MDILIEQRIHRAYTYNSALIELYDDIHHRRCLLNEGCQILPVVLIVLELLRERGDASLIPILEEWKAVEVKKIRDGIKAAFPGVGNITITSLGVVIGAHCGPGLLTVFYLCGGRRPE